MTNLQAALGLAQLEQLEKFIEIKHSNYMLYKELLSESDAFELLSLKDNIRSNHWFYSLHIKTENINRDEVIEHLKNANIQSRPIWGLIHEQLPYRNAQIYKIDKAKSYINSVVNLPCSTNLNKEDIIYVVEQLKSL
jgi:Predicted pyridoxal phosphate-dependent enzyme apparently involved in regulation of cell wall biogenesis